MQGGIVRSLCFLAFLSLGLVLADVSSTNDSHNVKRELNGVESQNQDLQQEQGRQGDHSESQHLNNEDNDVRRYLANYSPSNGQIDASRLASLGPESFQSSDSLRSGSSSAQQGAVPLDSELRADESGVNEQLGSRLSLDSESHQRTALDENEKSGLLTNVDSGEVNNNRMIGVQSRLINPIEYVSSAGTADLECNKELDLHYVRTWDQCLVCLCVKAGPFGWKLKAVCVSCVGCQEIIPIRPTVPPIPYPTSFPPIPYPTTYPPEPFPTTQPPTTLAPIPQAVCDPLPTNQPFPNPLNPCQICICRQVYNAYGQVEVQIQCDRDPSCIVPPDVTTLAPPPDPPEPIPLPSCSFFPTNVWFPHPSLECVLCKCVPTGNGQFQPQIYCVQTPDCYPFPTTTLVPTTEPYFPVTSERPLPPGPLPGPSPHQSCKPYPPNVPFEHPWDSCQMCVCSESQYVGILNIEVHCYTKPECCVEYATPAVLPATPSLVVKDPTCEFRSLNVQFTDPRDQCKVCTCEQYGNVIAATCSKVNTPECGGPPAPDGPVVFIEPKCRYRSPNQYFTADCNSCICEQTYNYVLARCVPIPNCVLQPSGGGSASANAYSIANSQNYPGQGGQSISSAQALSQAQAHGQAQAQSHASAQSGQAGYRPGTYPLYGGSQSLAEADAIASSQGGLYGPYIGSQSSANAQADSSGVSQAEAIANAANQNSGSSALANANANANSYRPSQSSPYGLISSNPSQQGPNDLIYQLSNYPASQGGVTNSIAEAIANAASQSNYQYPSYYGNPQYSGLYGGGGSIADASAAANAANVGYPSFYQGAQYPSLQGGSSSAEAAANAASLSGQYYSNPSSYSQYPYYAGNQYQQPQHGGSSSAAAEAIANAVNQGGGQGYSGYPGQAGLSSATADASASAGSGSNYPYLPGGNAHLYNPRPQPGSSSSYAKAIAKAKSKKSGNDVSAEDHLSVNE